MLRYALNYVGEEGIRSSGELDFVERSMVGFQADTRDLGATIHGSFWGKDCYDRDGRFQVWVAAFDGAGSYFNVGNAQNRPDDNQSKDLNLRMLVRPIWNDCIGHLELGGSWMGGHKGQTSSSVLYDPTTATGGNLGGGPQWGINRPGHFADRENVWLSYKAGSIFSGVWLRGEYTRIKDSFNPNSVIDFTGSGGGTAPDFLQNQGKPTSVQGAYGAIGFRFADSCWASDGGMPCWLKPVEVLARYDQFQNVIEANDPNPTQTNRFYTKCETLGVNYYIKGHNAKVQANYNWVQCPTAGNADRIFHKTDMDSFALNFQVSF